MSTVERPHPPVIHDLRCLEDGALLTLHLIDGRSISVELAKAWRNPDGLVVVLDCFGDGFTKSELVVPWSSVVMITGR